MTQERLFNDHLGKAIRTPSRSCPPVRGAGLYQDRPNCAALRGARCARTLVARLDGVAEVATVDLRAELLEEPL